MPGTEIVPRRRERVDARGRSLVAAVDLAVGAASRTTRLALRAGSMGRDASHAVGQLATALPGAGPVGELLNALARPLVDDGREVRARAWSSAQANAHRLIDTLAPGVIDTLDIDSLVQRIDIDALVQRIDIDALVQQIDIDAVVKQIDIDTLVRRIVIDAVVQRIDIDTLVQRIDIDTLVRQIAIDALVQRIDLDALVERLDVNEIVRRVDVNEIVRRVDVDSVVEETELGTIVARSTSGFASEALDAARSQTAVFDTLVSRAVNRILRRREGEVPVGPPLLAGEVEAENAVSEAAAEDAVSGAGGKPPRPAGGEPR